MAKTAFSSETSCTSDIEMLRKLPDRTLDLFLIDIAKHALAIANSTASPKYCTLCFKMLDRMKTFATSDRSVKEKTKLTNRSHKLRQRYAWERHDRDSCALANGMGRVFWYFIDHSGNESFGAAAAVESVLLQFDGAHLQASSPRHSYDRKYMWRYYNDLYHNAHRSRFKFNPVWKTTDTISIAREMLMTESFDIMPVLADAMEDAGCTYQNVLKSLRGKGPFGLSDWALTNLLF